jgi:hypothetical protein
MALKARSAARQEAAGGSDQLNELLADIERMEAKRDENLFRLAEKLGQVDKRLAAGAKLDAEAERWLRRYRQELQNSLAERRQLFGPQLADLLEPQGLRLRGQYPRLAAGLFTLTLNLEKGRCRIWYGPEQEELAEVALDPAKTAQELLDRRAGLGSALEVDELLAKLGQAYRHARLEHPDGQMPLLAVLPFMALMAQAQRFRADPRKGNYRDYGRADFSFDLYRLRELGSGMRLGVATRMQTQKRSDFLWVPTREETETGNYWATIDLKEEKL